MMGMRRVIANIIVGILTIIIFAVGWLLTGSVFLQQMLVITGVLLLAYLVSLRLREGSFLKRFASLISTMLIVLALSITYAWTKNAMLIEIIVYFSALALAWLTSFMFKSGEEK